MKTLATILTLAFSGLLFLKPVAAQDDSTAYVIVEYMKVKPGMNDEYLACEQAWKLIHQERVKAGYITGWELEQVLYPSGTGTEYDYLTITHYKNWKALNAENGSTFDALFKALPEDKREIANKAEEYRDLVKREIWTAGDRVFATGSGRPRYEIENFMKIPADGWDNWIDMESNFVKPVHEKNIALGNRAGWLMSFMVLPRGEELPYQASTVDFYSTWEDMAKNEGAAWEAVYPGISMEEIGKRIESARTLVRSELRQLVDFVE